VKSNQSSFSFDFVLFRVKHILIIDISRAECFRNKILLILKYRIKAVNRSKSCKVDDMSENPSPRDKALEALDFIINVLKEHEQTLDESIGELATVTEQVGKIDQINGKIEGIEDKISSLQKEIASLSRFISNAPRETICGEPKKIQPKTLSAEAQLAMNGGSPMVLNCKQWSAFQAFATHAQTLTFVVKAEEKTFEVKAINGNQIFIYNGPLPEFSSMLATYLNQQLDVPKQSIIEGALS
jgi:hypothetical protein